MKKTLNVNIGSVPFTIDEDAYHALNGYYEDVRSRLYEPEKKEIMEDIESRTADIFRENLAFPAQVVNIDLVKRTIAVIGSAQTFGERRYDADFDEDGDQEQDKPKKKLYRSRTSNVIGGVCGGLAEYMDADPSVVRIITFFFIFFTGFPLIVYIVMWIVVPLEPVERADRKRKGKKREDRQ